MNRTFLFIAHNNRGTERHVERFLESEVRELFSIDSHARLIKGEIVRVSENLDVVDLIAFFDANQKKEA